MEHREHLRRLFAYGTFQRHSVDELLLPRDVSFQFGNVLLRLREVFSHLLGTQRHGDPPVPVAYHALPLACPLVRAAGALGSEMK